MATKRGRKEPPDAAPAEDVQSPGPDQPLTDDERRERISVAAYYNAERRGFQTGGETDDWLEAERQVDGRSSEKGPKGEASAGAMTGRDQADTEAAVPPAATDRPDFPDLEQAGIEHVEPDEVQKWAKRLKVPAPRLREAIKRVGPVVNDIKRFLADSDQHA
jgi:hypothetical protein